MTNDRFDVLWDDNPVDVTAEANFIWSIANKLRGTYLPDKYGDVIIPMTIIRRFECALADTKSQVVEQFEKNPDYPAKAFEKITGYQFYNVSRFTLKELTNDPDNLASNFKDYVNGFSANVQDILKQLKLNDHIETMEDGGCLYTVVKAFSELDLDPKTYDPIKMGYIFENLIGRFFQNVDAGQYYTGRDIIKLLVSILISEGCDDIYQDHKVLTICDQACGTGGMLSTSYSYLKHINPTADIRLFGQEYMGPSYAVGLAEMLIKGQDARNFRHADTFKQDCFPETKMRFVIENPPFGTPWAGKDAKEGQEEAVKAEYEKRLTSSSCRWGAGLPSAGDSQLIFMQSAVDKMDDKNGRAAIIENGSPLFAGNTSSGESQIRRWMIENDLIEAIIALPTDLFYNTSIQTYVWILSKNKKAERKGKIQLIDASGIYHKLRKCLGYKKNELTPSDRKAITDLYTSFENGEFVKIYSIDEFLYREYTIMQPLQRSYGISSERIERMVYKGVLDNFYNASKMYEFEHSNEKLDAKELKKLQLFKNNEELYYRILKTLESKISDKVFYKKKEFEPYLDSVLPFVDKKLRSKIVDGLSLMDKKAEIQRARDGSILYDKDTKDSEIIKFNESLESYLKREVYPYLPDAKAFFEEDLTGKNPVIKTGAEIPFTRYFYKYDKPLPSEAILEEFNEAEKSIAGRKGSLVFNGKDCSNLSMDLIPWAHELPKGWKTIRGKYVFINDKEIVGARVEEFDRLALTLNGVIKRSKDDNEGLQPTEFNGYQILREGELVFKLIDLQNVSTSRVGLSPFTGIVSPAYIILKTTDEVYAPFAEKYYLMMWMNQVFNALGDAGVRSSLNAGELLDLRLPLPPYEKQKEIADYLDKKCSDIDFIISLKQKEVEILKTLKQSVVYEYITGKKEVPNE